MADGLDESSTRSYFEDIVKDFINEIKMLEQMKGTANIVNVEDYKVVEKTDAIGWDIHIRMELLTSLIDYSSGRVFAEAEVIKLGQDICLALDLCAKKNIIHRDVKPQNIFISNFGDFKIGDFGIARELEKTGSSFSTKGTYDYMAPEVLSSKKYDATVDTYSLGIVLYKLLNNNRIPFLDPSSKTIQYRDKISARDRRMSGEKLPKPICASEEMAEVVLKACAYDPHERFTSAKEMYNALEIIKKSLVNKEAPTITTINNEETTFVEATITEVSPLSQIEATVSPTENRNVTQEFSPVVLAPNKKNFKLNFGKKTNIKTKTNQEQKLRDKRDYFDTFPKQMGLALLIHLVISYGLWLLFSPMFNSGSNYRDYYDVQKNFVLFVPLAIILYITSGALLFKKINRKTYFASYWISIVLGVFILACSIIVSTATKTLARSEIDDLIFNVEAVYLPLNAFYAFFLERSGAFSLFLSTLLPPLLINIGIGLKVIFRRIRKTEIQTTNIATEHPSTFLQQILSVALVNISIATSLWTICLIPVDLILGRYNIILEFFITPANINTTYTGNPFSMPWAMFLTSLSYIVSGIFMFRKIEKKTYFAAFSLCAINTILMIFSVWNKLDITRIELINFVNVFTSFLYLNIGHYLIRILAIISTPSLLFAFGFWLRSKIVLHKVKDDI